MSKKILVTGATGTIGGFVCDQLLEANADFVAMARTEQKAAALNIRGIQTVIGDLSDIPSLEKALDGINKVFLLSVTSPDSPKLQGNLVKVAKEKGIKHIVKVSSLGASLDSPFGIPKFHGQTEKDIKESGIDYTFVRPHSFMQNLFFSADSIKNESAIYDAMGDGKIPMVDARDIAAVAVAALLSNGHEGETYNVTGPEAISYHDIAEALSNQLNRKINYVALDPEVARKGMLDAGMPDWLVSDMVEMGKLYAQNKSTELSMDVEKVTGRAPRSIKEFISDFSNKFQ